MPREENIVPLYSATEVQKRLQELAFWVNEEYAGRSPILLGVLNGGSLVTEEIARRVQVQHVITYVRATSYDWRTQPQKPVEVDFSSCDSVAGRDVLVIDDIADTGQTLAAILARLKCERPKGVRILVLASKPLRRIVHVPLDYVGFTVPDKFIVGCGMGRGEEFRDLPSLGYIAEP